FVLPEACLKEVEEGDALTVGGRSNQGRVLRDRRRGHRTRRADRAAQILPLKVSRDSLQCAEEERLVPHHRPAERAAELLAVEVVERRAVGQLAGQRLETLEMENGSVRLVGPRLRDDVDHATGCAAELGWRAARDHLKLL